MGKRKAECTDEEWAIERELQKARYQRWKEKHPNGERESAKRYRKNNPFYQWPAKREMGLYVTAYKERTPCTDCGHTFPACVMDFDHVSGEKVNNIGTMVAHGWSKEKILKEMAKCELVCANCHRIRTWKRKVDNNGVRSI